MEIVKSVILAASRPDCSLSGTSKFVDGAEILEAWLDFDSGERVGILIEPLCVKLNAVGYWAVIPAGTKMDIAALRIELSQALVRATVTELKVILERPVQVEKSISRVDKIGVALILVGIGGALLITGLGLL